MTAPSSDEVVDLALRFGAALEMLGVRYLVGGSVASSLLGEPRATNDLDFVVEMSPGQVRRLAELLGPDFVDDEEALSDALRTERSWNIFFLPTALKIDVFARQGDSFSDSEFARRRHVKLRLGSTARHVLSDALGRAPRREGASRPRARRRDGTRLSEPRKISRA